MGGVYGDGVEGSVPFVDGCAHRIALEAIDNEFLDLHRRSTRNGDVHTRDCSDSLHESCLLTRMARPVGIAIAPVQLPNKIPSIGHAARSGR